MTKIVKSNISTRIVNNKIKSYGGDLDTTKFRPNQIPVETPDGVIVVFTLPESEQYVSGKLWVFKDGIKQTKNVDYTETSSSTFTFTTAPDADETVIIDYIKS